MIHAYPCISVFVWLLLDYRHVVCLVLLLCPHVDLEFRIFWLIAQAFKKNSTESAPEPPSQARGLPLLGVTPKFDALQKLEQLAQVWGARYVSIAG